MAELRPTMREVFEMTTKQMEPDQDSWQEQQRRQRRRERARRVGALVVAAAIVVVAIVVVASNVGPEEAPSIATQPPPTPAAGSRFLDLRTGETTSLPESVAGGFSPLVSPDGTMFAYNSCCDPPIAVSVANIDGTNVQTVTPNDVDAYGHRWSPDGSTLVYQGRDGFNNGKLGDLFLLDVRTGDTTRVTHFEPFYTGNWFLDPSFSPDGRTILFHLPRDTTAGERWDLWSIPTTGGEPTLVRRDAASGQYSPDGTTIAYVDSPRGSFWEAQAIWIVDAEGHDPRPVAEGGSLGWPRWSPDGTRILYRDELMAGPTAGVYVVDVATGESTRVADVGPAEWFDDDTLIVNPDGS